MNLKYIYLVPFFLLGISQFSVATDLLSTTIRDELNYDTSIFSKIRMGKIREINEDSMAIILNGDLGVLQVGTNYSKTYIGKDHIYQYVARRLGHINQITDFAKPFKVLLEDDNPVIHKEYGIMEFNFRVFIDNEPEFSFSIFSKKYSFKKEKADKYKKKTQHNIDQFGYSVNDIITKRVQTKRNSREFTTTDKKNIWSSITESFKTISEKRSSKKRLKRSKSFSTIKYGTRKASKKRSNSTSMTLQQLVQEFKEKH